MPLPKQKKTMTVGAREANQHFSKMLREVELGTEVVITRNGKEIARLLPAAHLKDQKARQRAIEKMVAMMKKGLPIKPLGRRLTRDEMHEG